MIKNVQLDRFLLRNSQFSVRQLRHFIISGEVEVDGRVCSNTRQEIHAFTQVSLSGISIQKRQARYLMLNKPLGVVSATSHAKHKTVVDCVHETYATDLHLAGRLDFNTTGLMLLTNDGHWSRKITQPKEKKAKIYLVHTEDAITETYVQIFAQGMYFKYEDITLLPAALTIINDRTARLTIYEGRYHQIKRMFGFFNNKVVALHRESMGAIQLAPNLTAGEYRTLTAEEIDSVI